MSILFEVGERYDQAHAERVIAAGEADAAAFSTKKLTCGGNRFTALANPSPCRALPSCEDQMYLPALRSGLFALLLLSASHLQAQSAFAGGIAYEDHNQVDPKPIKLSSIHGSCQPADRTLHRAGSSPGRLGDDRQQG
jgi:hypothetical protein